jgi:hypothetical protein
MFLGVLTIFFIMELPILLKMNLGLADYFMPQRSLHLPILGGKTSLLSTNM